MKPTKTWISVHDELPPQGLEVRVRTYWGGISSDVLNGGNRWNGSGAIALNPYETDITCWLKEEAIAC